ncbi:MAG TPA: YggS family pyridoxal phosphate-dependent enzyme [Acidimicrobiia bacterium]|nr:YggS family pyridoxal phosphate-dependent enzyme [Acidimicrobiia bacterium]
MSYREVLDRVATVAERAGRSPDDITVVAVSKTMSRDDIMAVYDQGHRDFGENRAGELAEKAPALPGDIRWHYVGALQSNKARMVRGVTHLLHSMDRRSLGEAWMKGHGLPPPVLAQVNMGDESQKSGVSIEELPRAIEWMVGMGLDVRGLMAIPPLPDRPEDSRVHFRTLRDLRDQVGVGHPSVAELSMGMTDDFEVAIDEGASMIRVGRAIFGPRKPTGA